MNIPYKINLIMCQNNKYFYSARAEALQLTIQEAIIFLETRQYSYNKQALHGCQSFHQIFSFLMGLQQNPPSHIVISKTQKIDLEQHTKLQENHNNLAKTKLSTKSTSSECTNKSIQESTLVQQIQRQQETIEKLKSQLYKTEKMVLITKKLQREAYKSIDETIDLILKKDAKIEKMIVNQEVLLKKIKERDQLLEYTISIIEKR